MSEGTRLSPAFRHVRLLLARGGGHPSGSRDEGYDLLVPLDAGGHIDAAEWKHQQEACRVRHFRPGEQDRIGRLRREPGGQWYLDYGEGERDDEIGFRFGAERFVTGEYVSLIAAAGTRAFRIARVEKP